MASYAELFDIGEDFAAFVGHGLATEQGAVARFRQKLESNGLPSALTERLQRIERRYRLLVAGEMWCPDCQINLAALDFAQRLQPNIELAIISKGRAEDDLRQRLALERIAIPLVLVLDEEFNLLGRFVERPQAVLDGGPQALAAYKAGDYGARHRRRPGDHRRRGALRQRLRPLLSAANSPRQGLGTASDVGVRRCRGRASPAAPRHRWPAPA